MEEAYIRRGGFGNLFDAGYRSPPIPVRLEGFEATTTQLQRSGWEISCDEDYSYENFRFAFLNRKLGLIAVSERICRDVLIRAMSLDGERYGRTPICVTQITRSRELVYYGPHLTPSAWHAIDAEPTFIGGRPISSEDLFLFRPAGAPAAKEIIADPETVADLMEKIIKLQKPDVDAIRERNRRREARGDLTGMVTHAKIISFKEVA